MLKKSGLDLGCSTPVVAVSTGEFLHRNNWQDVLLGRWSLWMTTKIGTCLIRWIPINFRETLISMETIQPIPQTGGLRSSDKRQSGPGAGTFRRTGPPWAV